jgi:hypothetical protein
LHVQHRADRALGYWPLHLPHFILLFRLASYPHAGGLTRVLRGGKKTWSRHFRGQYGVARGPEQRRHDRPIKKTM